MDPLLMSSLIVISIGTGVLGTIFGIGGGIIFIPVLTILYDLPATAAVAVSLVGIIASSTGAASYFVKEGQSNIRLGLLLEITTTIGAMVGAIAAMYIANWIMLAVFGCVLVYSAATMLMSRERIVDPADDKGPLVFTYCDAEQKGRGYKVENIRSGLGLCTIAGVMSSMTGVGGGTIKIPLMNVHMHVPIKVASATSSYMIGITAFSGAIIYFLHGDLLLDYAATVAVGAFIGSIVGTRISEYVNAGPFRKYFSILLLAISVLIFLEAGGIL